MAGGASASLTPLDRVYEHFKKEGKPGPEFGRTRDYNIDLIPKFLMANGSLVQALVYTGVTRCVFVRLHTEPAAEGFKGANAHVSESKKSACVCVCVCG
jgi:Rab GDP dissociation inhibitor